VDTGVVDGYEEGLRHRSLLARGKDTLAAHRISEISEPVICSFYHPSISIALCWFTHLAPAHAMR